VTRLLLEDQHLFTVCTGCAGLFSQPGGPNGLLAASEVPTAGFVGREVTEAHRASGVLSRAKYLAAFEGVCVECAGVIECELTVCADHETADGPCPRCGTATGTLVRMHCTACKTWLAGPARTTAGYHPAVVAFRYERGVSIGFEVCDTGPSLGACGVSADREERVLSADPPRVEIVVRHEDREPVLTVDETVCVVDVQGPRPVTAA
jgi:hypothetical protein